MEHPKKYYDALDDILDRPIAFNPSFKRITGSTNAALLLSQAFYWSKRTNDPEGWFYKTRIEWMEETGLTEDELDGAREKCKKSGVIEEKLRGVPATLYYRVVKPKVYELLGVQIPTFPESGIVGNRQIPEKQESGKAGNFNKKSESTTGITEEEYKAALEARCQAMLKLYKKSISPEPAPLMLELIVNACKTYENESWYAPAFESMVKAGAKSFTYVETYLENKSKGKAYKQTSPIPTKRTFTPPTTPDYNAAVARMRKAKADAKRQQEQTT